MIVSYLAHLGAADIALLVLKSALVGLIGALLIAVDEVKALPDTVRWTSVLAGLLLLLFSATALTLVLIEVAARIVYFLGNGWLL